MYPRLNKAHAAYHVVKGMIEGGASPVEITNAVSFRKTNCFHIIDGEDLSEDEFIARAVAD